MRSLKTIGANDLRKCTSGLLQQSCGSIRGQLYCNYVKQLSTVPVCSSAYFSTQLWDRCCNAPTTSIPQSPYPLPALTTTTTPTTTTITTTPTTTTITTTTPAPVKACGISTKNPASKYADFANTLRQFRIVGGANAEVCEYPWMVRLQMGNNLCGGTIIDETHVMTAGHCVGFLKPEDMTVYVGEYNYNIQESQDQQVGVTAVNLHPDYREVPPAAAENDIAILTMDRPLTYSDCVQPICLAQPGDSASLDNAQCTTIGWGRTAYNGNPSPILQKVTMPTYSGALCDAQFPNTTPTNPNVQICAGRPAGGADSCQGDSGGPLFCPVDGKYVQYGIVSYGDNCALSGNAGVYTDIGEMTNFINSVI
ncbi:trypsin [Patella vulgata]|uniref:trypsin n=1 Tax=Patella vulgata TaxID=6465 RepID=UPI00217FB007|nr:trypsin [Patella vulgata]